MPRILTVALAAALVPACLGWRWVVGATTGEEGRTS
jgi:hypothetical protein